MSNPLYNPAGAHVVAAAHNPTTTRDELVTRLMEIEALCKRVLAAELMEWYADELARDIIDIIHGHGIPPT